MARQRTGHSRGQSLSRNSPHRRPVRATSRDSNQSMSATKKRPRQALHGRWQWTAIVRKKSAIRDCPRPKPRSERALAMHPYSHRLVHAFASPWPPRGPPVSQFTSAAFESMSSFDPAAVRKAVEEFTPRRPQKFQDLLPAKEVILELRQKQASYRSIADLLTQHCLPTSKTAVAMFCHQVLGESVRPRKRPGRRQQRVSTVSTHEAAPDQATNRLSAIEPVQNPNGDEVQPARTRGPRIAQVRVLKPQTS
jgi:hypothetical protein